MGHKRRVGNHCIPVSDISDDHLVGNRLGRSLPGIFAGVFGLGVVFVGDDGLFLLKSGLLGLVGASGEEQEAHSKQCGECKYLFHNANLRKVLTLQSKY